MEQSQERIAETIRELIEASREAREALALGERTLNRSLHQLEQGSRITDILRASPARTQRELTSQTLSRHASLRHRLRLITIRECDKEGMVAREVSEIWGFSRQRASQFIVEARRLPPGD